MKTPREWAALGQVRRITSWDEPVMRSRTRPVTDFGPELKQLVADMFATMRVAQGVGLAGPQVGEDLAIFVFNCPDGNDHLVSGVMCNPTIELPEGRERKFEATEEGCLSWPGAYQLLARPDYALCSAQDENGDRVEVEGTGLLARCLQHETDHLSGTVFGDRLSNRARRELDKQKTALAHLYPADWPITPKGRQDDSPPDQT